MEGWTVERQSWRKLTGVMIVNDTIDPINIQAYQVHPTRTWRMTTKKRMPQAISTLNLEDKFVSIYAATPKKGHLVRTMATAPSWPMRLVTTKRVARNQPQPHDISMYSLEWHTLGKSTQTLASRNNAQGLHNARTCQREGYVTIHGVNLDRKTHPFTFTTFFASWIWMVGQDNHTWLSQSLHPFNMIQSLQA